MTKDCLLNYEFSTRKLHVVHNQRASTNELRAAIDVGQKQYRPKQLK